MSMVLFLWDTVFYIGGPDVMIMSCLTCSTVCLAAAAQHMQLCMSLADSFALQNSLARRYGRWYSDNVQKKIYGVQSSKVPTIYSYTVKRNILKTTISSWSWKNTLLIRENCLHYQKRIFSSSPLQLNIHVKRSQKLLWEFLTGEGKYPGKLRAGKRYTNAFSKILEEFQAVDGNYCI